MRTKKRERLRRQQAREQRRKKKAEEKAKKETFALVLGDEDLVSVIVKHLNLLAIQYSCLNVTFAKEARRNRPEYLTVCAGVKALISTLEQQEQKAELLKDWEDGYGYPVDDDDDNDKLFWTAPRYCKYHFGWHLLLNIVYPGFPIMKDDY